MWSHIVTAGDQQGISHRLESINKSVSKQSECYSGIRLELQPLHPFLDNEGYLRVGGRLQRSHLPYDSKHQLILPPAHHLTELIIMNEHLRLLYVGPFEIKGGNTRSKTITKCYIALFICMGAKAVHLELVSDLTSEAFIAALKCFIARRGLIDHLDSDSGSNFVGASKELKAFFKSEEFLRQVHSYTAKTPFQWHFIPLNSPHFGGLCEAGVKSLKCHWKKIVGKALLTLKNLALWLQK